jgi:hypothetical protein|tara:strand:+ start:185 stop:472 length:288 start_codon:yes stop_codon:yes gene_type:complete
MDSFLHNHQSALDSQREDDAIRDLEDAGIYPVPGNDTILEKFYEEEYEAIYLEIANESDVTESGEDWVTPTEEDKEIMHKLATKRAKKRFEDLLQ